MVVVVVVVVDVRCEMGDGSNVYMIEKGGIRGSEDPNRHGSRVGWAGAESVHSRMHEHAPVV